MDSGECCVTSLAPSTMEDQLALATSEDGWNGLEIDREELYFDTWLMQIQVTPNLLRNSFQ